MTAQDLAREQAKAQIASICQMVSALEVDYDRLEELQDAASDSAKLVAEIDRLKAAVATAKAELEAAQQAADTAAELLEAAEDSYHNLHYDLESAEQELEDLSYGEDEAKELSELLESADECTCEDDARDRITEDALDVQVRSDWQSIGEELLPTQFLILLCTGGPAVRIVGDLDRGTPSRPRIEYQDWGTPWTEFVPLESWERDAIETYCEQFCFE